MREENSYEGEDLTGALDISLPARGGPDLLAASADDTDRRLEQLHPWDRTSKGPAEKVSDRASLPWPVIEAASSDPAAP